MCTPFNRPSFPSCVMGCGRSYLVDFSVWMPKRTSGHIVDIIVDVIDFCFCFVAV